jgi:hypothetical protein
MAVPPPEPLLLLDALATLSAPPAPPVPPEPPDALEAGTSSVLVELQADAINTRVAIPSLERARSMGVS